MGLILVQLIAKMTPVTNDYYAMNAPSIPTEWTPPANHHPGSEGIPTSVEEIKRSILQNLFHHQGRFPAVAAANDYYLALAYTVREWLMTRWLRAAQTYFEQTSRTVAYLSAEFLLGPHLENNLVNLGLLDLVRQAVEEMGQDLNTLIQQEEEPGLGNGGLGRLAACYLDSLATLSIPAIGYGIRYEFGIFDQAIQDGWQMEVTDKWLKWGNPWEIARPEVAFQVKLGGHTEAWRDEQHRYRVNWIPHRVVKGIAYDTPIMGYQSASTSLLRLWKAEASESFDFRAFNAGDYYKAVEEKIFSENLTKVLYPNDEPAAGRELRLGQQYFLVSCALQDLIRIFLQREKSFDHFPEKYAMQLNDTHPALAVAELMRLLVDDHLLDWDMAWDITTRTFSYTNHTLLPEALEKWPVALLGRILPRHLEIIYEINRRFLDEVRQRCPDDPGRLARMSLIDEGGERYVRMAHLACVGSHTVNGVAELHSELLKRDVLGDFSELWPGKIVNVTNGVTPRRFLLVSNPIQARLITEHIGDGWIRNLDELRRLQDLAGDPAFQAKWRVAQTDAKRTLARLIRERTGIEVNPDHLFDIQVKRIHEYKRQHLNVLHIIHCYNRLRQNPDLAIPSRVCIFGGKAAPGYFMAKLIIKLINSVAEVVNHDPAVQGRLKVVFFPDYNVKNAQPIYPAADLSEQISTAGKEASGTGNMKFALNGALTIGTLDGANIEIREEVGSENFFLFGLTAQEVRERKHQGYHPGEYYQNNADLRAVIDQIQSGYFSRGDARLFEPLVSHLLHRDDYMLMADFESYIDCQERVNHAFLDQEKWTRMSILTVSRMGKFSSDRAIQDYCRRIWHVQPVEIPET